MFRRFSSRFGVALLAAGALVFGVSEARAQRGGGGGRGGGGHGGGAHVGGAHVGGAHVGGAHVGGAHVGGAHVGGVPGGGGRVVVGPGGGARVIVAPGGFYGGLRGAGYGLGLYRPYYGYGALGYGGLGYGGYGGYGGYAPYYGGPAYASYAAPVTDPGYIAPAVASNPQESPDNAAHLQFNVPEGAEVWFDSTLTKQTGSVREYTSPPLSPGRRFTYKISVRYRDANGKEINDTRPIHVRANDWFSIDFTRPAPPEPPAQPKAPAAPPGEER